MTNTKRPARAKGSKPDPVERARAEAAKIEILTVSPDLATMLVQFHEAAARIRRAPSDAVGDPWCNRHAELHKAIAAFPAASLADLCAKLPLFRDDLESAWVDRELRENDDLDVHSLHAIVRDLERLADIHGLTLPATAPGHGVAA